MPSRRTRDLHSTSMLDTIGEMVYGMDIDRQAHRARETQFDQQADGDVLQRSKPRNLYLAPGPSGAVESLNVATTAAVLCFEAARQRRGSMVTAP